MVRKVYRILLNFEQWIWLCRSWKRFKRFYEYIQIFTVFKISIINVAENEWSSALSNDWGSHPFDIIENSRIIKNEKKGSDYVFLIFHGGHEYYDLPSPNLKKNMRYLVEQGLIWLYVITLIVSGYELYKEKYIFYGIGNFLFTKASKNEEWYGVVLDLELNLKKS